jgi:acetyl esterase/lipase
MKAALATPPILIVSQLLVLPVINNTALPTAEPWVTNGLAPWLTPSRMLWYRRKYLQNEEDCLKWTASPNLAPTELLKKSPKTWVAVAECDLLAPEAIAYGKQLEEVGVDVEFKTYKGATYSLLAGSGE